MTEFINERGNKITVNVRVTEGGDIEMSIIGPESEITSLVTYLEADHLNRLLSKILTDEATKQ